MLFPLDKGRPYRCYNYTMLDTLEIFNQLREDFPEGVARKIATLMGRIYNELANTVTKTEFNELKEVVRELAEAQKRTEARVEELAEAQKNSEARLTRLEKTVEELAEAQKRTEKSLEEFKKTTEENFQRVWNSINELSEAQKRTEEEIRKLSSALNETRRQVGDITDTIGYTLENAAYKALPELLKRDYALTVKGRIKRGYLKDRRGKDVEVNILGEGVLKGKKVIIVGESKSRLSKKKIQEFINRRLKRLEGIYGDLFPVLVTHMISEPDVEEYAGSKGIALYYSYDF